MAAIVFLVLCFQLIHLVSSQNLTHPLIRSKRQIQIGTIDYLMVIDSTAIRLFGGRENAERVARSVISRITDIYADIDPRVKWEIDLIRLIFWDTDPVPIVTSNTAKDYETQFNRYMKYIADTYYKSSDSYDTAMILSGLQFVRQVGWSSVDTLCQPLSGGMVTTHYGQRQRTKYDLSDNLAVHIGRNFGLKSITKNDPVCPCPTGCDHCVMYHFPFYTRTPDNDIHTTCWTRCSRQKLLSLISDPKAACLNEDTSELGDQ